MTPEEARAMSAPDYLGFLKHMDDEAREQKRQARRRARKRG